MCVCVSVCECVCVRVCVCVCAMRVCAMCVWRQDYAPLTFFVLLQYTLVTCLCPMPGVLRLFQVTSDDAQLPSVIISIPHQDLTARLPSNHTVNLHSFTISPHQDLNSPHYIVSQHPRTRISTVHTTVSQYPHTRISTVHTT